jgi:hypothetical protein
MKHAKNFLCFLVLSGFGAVIYAQSSITTTGGNATGSGGSVSYSVGQMRHMILLQIYRNSIKQYQVLPVLR